MAAVTRLGPGGIPRRAFPVDGVAIICTMDITEPGDIATFVGIVEVLQGNDGVIWSIMRDIMQSVMRAVQQSDENDS